INGPGDQSSNGSFAGGVFTPSGDDAQADIHAIVSSLDSGTDVIIYTTGGGGTQDGDITISKNISYNPGINNTVLTLNAEDDIIFGGGGTRTISDNGAVGNSSLVFNFGQDGNDGDPSAEGILDLNGAVLSVDSVQANGGTSSDIIIAGDLSNTWNVTGADAGTVSNADATVTFSSVENLMGGTDTDTFTLSGGTLSGAIAG
ncbi:hypothetical protein C6A37_09065, partial [Desulfobacteraceae bacterium SEEP-SAG9]